MGGKGERKCSLNADQASPNGTRFSLPSEAKFWGVLSRLATTIFGCSVVSKSCQSNLATEALAENMFILEIECLCSEYVVLGLLAPSNLPSVFMELEYVSCS